MHFQLGGKYTFNFLEYESEFASKYFDPSIGITLTDNLVRMFCTIMEVSERNQGGGANESFWQKTLRQLLRNAIDLVLFAGEPLSFQKIYDVIITAPTSPYYIENDEDKQSLSWREDSFCWQCMQRADAEIEEGDPRYPDSLITLKYWSKEFPALDPRTRSSIVIQFTSMADVFLRGVLRDLFSPEEGKSKERLDPDVTHLGRVIILNLPVKLYNEIGQFAQVLYKFIWQRATERRNLNDNLRKQRPVFLWADEAQFFVNSNDMLFQTTARSKQAATVYLTQNISNYYALMPGDKGRAETDSILGNFQTKIFHANGDSVTNLWAANLIGMDWDYRENTSTSLSSRDEIATANQGSSIQQHFQHQVLPKRFTTLKKGGPTAENWVEGIIFQAGRVWANKCNYKAIKLKQEFLPPPSDTKSLSSSFWQG